jgi:hypothetical protein
MRDGPDRVPDPRIPVRDPEEVLDRGATLIFVLIGVPLALRLSRGGVGMVIAVSLAVFAVYYVGLIGGETLADEGTCTPRHPRG